MAWKKEDFSVYFGFVPQQEQKNPEGVVTTEHCWLNRVINPLCQIAAYLISEEWDKKERTLPIDVSTIAEAVEALWGEHVPFDDTTEHFTSEVFSGDDAKFNLFMASLSILENSLVNTAYTSDNGSLLDSQFMRLMKEINMTGVDDHIVDVWIPGRLRWLGTDRSKDVMQYIAKNPSVLDALPDTRFKLQSWEVDEPVFVLTDNMTKQIAVWATLDSISVNGGNTSANLLTWLNEKGIKLKASELWAS